MLRRRRHRSLANATRAHSPAGDQAETEVRLPGDPVAARQDADDQATVHHHDQDGDGDGLQPAFVVSAADQEAEVAEDQAAGADVRRVAAEHPQTQAAEHDDGKRCREVGGDAADGPPGRRE